MLKHGTIITGALAGVEAFKVQITATVTEGLPSFVFVGPFVEGAQRETRIRVESSIKTSGFTFPAGRITVEIKAVDAAGWPSGRKVDGTALDLPIALAVLIAAGQLPDNETVGTLVAFGELSLSGEVRPVRGAILLARLRAHDTHSGRVAVVCPIDNGAEAAAGEVHPNIRCVRTLRDAAGVYATGTGGDFATPRATTNAPPIDFRDIKGQGRGRRATEIAAAGGHNLMLTGGPGAGKTMLARRIASILPDMTETEALEVTEVHSCAGLNMGAGLQRSRPFRAPHHSTTPPGLVGGGTAMPRPGEITLAHRGVLFLDEVPEFAKASLEVLREPVTTRRVDLSRASGTLRFPADAMLVGSQNPCPCGHAGSKRCKCEPDSVKRYRARSAGVEALCDVRCEVEPIDLKTIDDATPGEDSATIKARVLLARGAQADRGCLNARMTEADVSREVRAMPATARALLATYVNGVAATVPNAGRVMPEVRAINTASGRVVRVARTIADLAGLDVITDLCLSEALQLTK